MPEGSAGQTPAFDEVCPGDRLRVEVPVERTGTVTETRRDSHTLHADTRIDVRLTRGHWEDYAVTRIDQEAGRG